MIFDAKIKFPEFFPPSRPRVRGERNIVMLHAKMNIQHPPAPVYRAKLRAKSTRAKEQKEHQKSTRAERTEASSGEQKEQSESELGGLAYV